MVGAYRAETDAHLFHVIAMWVAPEVRGEGIGRQLLSQVEEWIRSCGGHVVQLHVTTTAEEARGLSDQTAGFEPDGHRRRSTHTPGLFEQKPPKDPSVTRPALGVAKLYLAPRHSVWSLLIFDQLEPFGEPADIRKSRSANRITSEALVGSSN